MFPLFISITRHTVWAFLIIILSFLINDLVLARYCFITLFLLWVFFLNCHLPCDCIKLRTVYSVCFYCTPTRHVPGSGWSPFRLISQHSDEWGSPPSPVFISFLVKFYLLIFLIIWWQCILCHYIAAHFLIIKLQSPLSETGHKSSIWFLIAKSYPMWSAHDVYILTKGDSLLIGILIPW